MRVRSRREVFIYKYIYNVNIYTYIYRVYIYIYKYSIYKGDFLGYNADIMKVSWDM